LLIHQRVNIQQDFLFFLTTLPFIILYQTSTMQLSSLGAFRSTTSSKQGYAIFQGPDVAEDSSKTTVKSHGKIRPVSDESALKQHMHGKGGGVHSEAGESSITRSAKSARTSVAAVNVKEETCTAPARSGSTPATERPSRRKDRKEVRDNKENERLENVRDKEENVPTRSGSAPMESPSRRKDRKKVRDKKDRTGKPLSSEDSKSRSKTASLEESTASAELDDASLVVVVVSAAKASMAEPGKKEIKSEKKEKKARTTPAEALDDTSLVFAVKDNMAEPDKQESKSESKKKEKKTRKTGKKKTKRSSQVHTALDLLDDEDEDVTTELVNTDPEGTIRLQRLLSEAFAKVSNVSEERTFLEKDNVSKVFTEFAELKAENSKISQGRCELLVNLEEREESLKGSKKRIAALEGAVQSQLDLHDSLQIKLERADDEIDEMESEILKLEEEIGTLQEIYSGYEELQQELVKEKEKLVERELSFRALKENQSGGVKGLEEKLKSQELEASAKLSEKHDAIAALQKEVVQLKNIAIARESEDHQYFLQELQEYKAEVVAVRNSLEDARLQIGIIEEDNEELQSVKENLEDEAMSLKVNVTKIADESNAFQKEVTVWTEAASEWKRRAEAAQKQLDAGSPVPVDAESTKELVQDMSLEAAIDSKRRSCEVTNDSPQALFLQAAMERKRERQRTSGNATQRLLRKRSMRAILFQPMT
jgi:hypothetical protein